MRNDYLTHDEQHFRTGILVEDGRLQPKAKRSVLTVSEYDQLPKFTSSPVVDLPISPPGTILPSSSTYPIPRHGLAAGGQLQARGETGTGEESEVSEFDAGRRIEYMDPSIKGA